MTDRIKYVNDSEVSIKPNSVTKLNECVIRISSDDLRLMITYNYAKTTASGYDFTASWDDDGRDALIEVLSVHVRDRCFRYYRPEPTYRPLTAKEAVNRIGCEFCRSDGYSYMVRFIGECGLRTTLGGEFTYEELFTGGYRWKHNGELCAVKVEE